MCRGTFGIKHPPRARDPKSRHSFYASAARSFGLIYYCLLKLLFKLLSMYTCIVDVIGSKSTRSTNFDAGRRPQRAVK